jgi:hypothetical protein
MSPGELAVLVAHFDEPDTVQLLKQPPAAGHRGADRALVIVLRAPT